METAWLHWLNSSQEKWVAAWNWNIMCMFMALFWVGRGGNLRRGTGSGGTQSVNKYGWIQSESISSYHSFLSELRDVKLVQISTSGENLSSAFYQFHFQCFQSCSWFTPGPDTENAMMLISRSCKLCTMQSCREQNRECRSFGWLGGWHPFHAHVFGWMGVGVG